MSKTTFRITRRDAAFGKLNPRTEYHGEEKEAATDIKVTFRATKRDLDMLMPQQDGTKASDVFYTKEGHLRMPYLVPLPINRHPEHLLVTIVDQNTSRKTPPLVFADAKAKKIVVEMKPKFEMIVSMMLQLKVDAESQAARLYSIMDNERELEVSAQQEEMDLFLTPDEKKEKQADAFDEDDDDSDPGADLDDDQGDDDLDADDDD